jgi:3-hydroxy-9,10-secoandrosta-1,3,5(10)-triene-9,17-dione monooxygenase
VNAPADRPRADFAGVGYDEAVARARALVPMLRERAAETEARGDLLPEVEQVLHETGLFRICQPRRWGGMELDYLALCDVPYELARGCASTSWTFGNYAIHHWMLAMYDERAQVEVWGANPDARIASGIAYPQGRATAVEGGYRVSGTWNFSSGSPLSDWNMLAALVREGDKVVGHRMCLLHRSEYELVDDWQVLGMRGTGSQSVRAADVFVPEHRALDALTCRGGAGFPGARTNSNPIYQLPLGVLGAHCIVATAVGNAQGALELTCEHVKARTTSYTGASMRDFQAVQLRTGGAGARIEAARLLCNAGAERGMKWAASGYLPTVEERLAIKRDAAYAVTLSTEAVDLLHGMAGANGIYDSYPIQRIFRDAHALGAHYQLTFDVHGSAWGLAALGGEVRNPVL